MPVSKKRKKNGKAVGNGQAGQHRRHNRRLRDKDSGVSLDDMFKTMADLDSMEAALIRGGLIDEGIDKEHK